MKQRLEAALVRLNVRSAMNRLNVRDVILAGLGIELLMCLFPPWRTQIPQQGFSLDTGYAFLFSPPNQLAGVDIGRLLVQMLLVGILVAVSPCCFGTAMVRLDSEGEMKNRVLAAGICACLATGSAQAADDCGITATFQSFIDFIKFGCHQDFPNDQQKWVECATQRYEAMRAFHEKLYRYRDTQGLQSAGFKRGLECIEEAAPRVSEPDRKFAMERANWIKANTCLEAFAKK